MSFQSHSQAGQDFVAHQILGDGPGRYIDIGACHPIQISNTYVFDQMGWDGILVDNDPGSARLCRELRTGLVLEGDGTNIDWYDVIRRRWGSTDLIDYVSIDIDEATEDALINFLIKRTYARSNLGVRVMTIETDVYRLGTNPRDRMREILEDHHGLDLFCADVCSVEGLQFEDWFCHPELSHRADRFRCQNTKWPEIISR